ncbi:hypothetical protein [Micromonospora sp. WMMD710]|nr:hypothetical protein [Micromonospora sp. WMMD710]MDG4761375.1 hypothetical protein [Micromonospora sp. WMMD710]
MTDPAPVSSVTPLPSGKPDSGLTMPASTPVSSAYVAVMVEAVVTLGV